jgi:CRP-like cAMP-binding protein
VDAVVADVVTARRNAILDGLTDAELEELLPYMTDVSLARGQVLYEKGLPINAAHFPTTGMVSLVQELSASEIVEIATVGREGMSGISLFFGATAPSESAIVQISGRALRISAPDFLQQISVLDGPLQLMLRRYTQAMFTQLGRNAACNRVHRVRQRAARWLMMCSDRVEGPTFDLTQEFLAQMLAVRRASVGEVAQALADDGCISYTRGSVTILDIKRLHENACECYDVITQATREAMRST